MEQIIELTAARILIVGGLFNIAFGFIMGHSLGLFRLKNPDAPYRYILSAHKSGLQQGFLLLGLVYGIIKVYL